MNTASPKDLDMALTSSSGISSTTLHASLAYIGTHSPQVFLLENIWRKSTAQKVMALLKRSLPDYIVICFLIDARAVGSASSRNRLFFIGMNAKSCQIVRPLETWVNVLEHVAAQMRMAAPSLEELMLPDEHASVLGLKAQLVSTKNGVRTRSWDLTRQSHMKVRRAVEEKFNLPPLPAPEAQSPLPDGASKEWVGLLPPRQQDLIYLHSAVAVANGVQPKDHGFVWDISNNIFFKQAKNPSAAGHVPCLLCTHKYYHTKRQRLLSGLEVMLLQGFPASIDVGMGGDHALKEAELRSLAGNTICVPVVGLLWALIYTSIRIGHRHACASNEVSGQQLYKVKAKRCDSSTYDVLPGSSRFKAKVEKRKRARPRKMKKRSKVCGKQATHSPS
jgi:site-specific DNA-cytosine methylase